MTSTMTETRTARLTVAPADANAIVYAVAFEATSIGEALMNAPADSPGDLYRIAGKCRRLTALADVAEQLQWRTHHGAHGHPQDPLPVEADVATVLDLAALLDRHARDHELYPDSDPYPVAPATFTTARAALASAVASQAVTA